MRAASSSSVSTVSGPGFVPCFTLPLTQSSSNFRGTLKAFAAVDTAVPWETASIAVTMSSSTACASYSEPFLMSKRKYITLIHIHYQSMGKLRTKCTLKIHPATRELVIIKLHARTSLKGSSTPSPGETSKIWWVLSKNRPVSSHKQLQREKTHQNEACGMKNLLSMRKQK